jgi:hypothetical protein
MITDDDGRSVARALRHAAHRWPEHSASRAQLLLALILEGDRAISEQAGDEAAERREAILATSGVLTGTYGASYLNDLRSDWAE